MLALLDALVEVRHRRRGDIALRTAERIRRRSPLSGAAPPAEGQVRRRLAGVEPDQPPGLVAPRAAAHWRHPLRHPRPPDRPSPYRLASALSGGRSVVSSAKGVTRSPPTLARRSGGRRRHRCGLPWPGRDLRTQLGRGDGYRMGQGRSPASRSIDAPRSPMWLLDCNFNRCWNAVGGDIHTGQYDDDLRVPVARHVTLDPRPSTPVSRGTRRDTLGRFLGRSVRCRAGVCRLIT